MGPVELGERIFQVTREENAALHRLAENQRHMIAALTDEVRMWKWIAFAAGIIIVGMTIGLAK